jgi:hypothetical protein
VPEGCRLEDYTDLLAEALTALARSGTPSARRILLGLTVPGDEIRWQREAPGVAGAVPWNAADRMRSAARAMLMAAVRADCVPAGFFGQRYDRFAAGYVAQVLVGPSSGGHVLTAYIPAPEGRGAALTLLRGLQAVRDAVDHRRATGSMEAFDAAVRLGVCRELTRAVVRLVRDSEGAQVCLAWSPAAGTPLGFADRPRTVEFSPGDLPALQQAGERYRELEPSVPVRITGSVVRLRLSRPGVPGTVRLRVLAGADVRHVRAELEPDDYRTAAHAHLSGVPIRVSGRLESRGGFRTLTGAEDVTPVHVDDAERDRLLKSLQEQADLIGGAREGED